MRVEVYMLEKYSQSQIETALAKLNQSAEQPWSIQDNKLYKAFKFTDFIAAFGFMSQVAMNGSMCITR